MCAVRQMMESVLMHDLHLHAQASAFGGCTQDAAERRMKVLRPSTDAHLHKAGNLPHNLEGVVSAADTAGCQQPNDSSAKTLCR